MNTAQRARPHRISEGTTSAKVINSMPRPLLLDTSTVQDTRAVLVAGNFEQRAAESKPKRLRLIKPAPASALCGFGTCALDPACTKSCRYREADQALRGDLDSRHTQRAAMPPARPTRTNPIARRITWALLALWCVGWTLGPVAWWLFA